MAAVDDALAAVCVCDPDDPCTCRDFPPPCMPRVIGAAGRDRYEWQPDDGIPLADLPTAQPWVPPHRRTTED